MESKFDIDKTLNDTAKKNKLTKMNVKNLIKVLLCLLILIIKNIYCN